MATPKQLDRQDRMIAAALAEFCKRGFHKANIDDIAANAKVGKGTLYRHFNHKEGLFLAVFDATLDRLTKTIREKADFRDFEKASRVVTKTYLKEIQKNPDVFHFLKLFTSDQHFADSDIRQKLADRYFSAALWAVDEITLGQKRGQIRKNLDAHQASISYLGMLHFLVYYWLKNGRTGNLEKDGELACDIFLHGITCKDQSKKKAPAKKKR